MHRPALAPTITGRSAEKLGHHQTQISSLSDAVAVSPVGGRDVVILPEIGTNPRGNRLLADIKVNDPHDHLSGIEIHHLLLEPTDSQHRSVKLHHLLFVQLHGSSPDLASLKYPQNSPFGGNGPGSFHYIAYRPDQVQSIFRHSAGKGDEVKALDGVNHSV